MRLKRVIQCALCPWRKDCNPHEIPDGYDVEKHRALKSTIAPESPVEQVQSLFSGTMRVMACHETQDAHCVGWLVNQIGVGNNIALRIAMRDCENMDKVRTIGPQHETFEETLPV